MPIKKATRKHGLKLHQGDVKGLRRRGLDRTGGLHSKRKLRGSGGPLNVDDAGVHFRKVVEGFMERVDWFAPPLHQFQGFFVGGTRLKIMSGTLAYLKGLSSDGTNGLVMSHVDVPISDAIPITGAGSIWMKADWTVTQHSTSSSSSSTTLQMYRITSLTFNEYTFETSDPTEGIDATDTWASGAAYYEICEVDLVQGRAAITKQLINGMILAPDLVDGEVT